MCQLQNEIISLQEIISDIRIHPQDYETDLHRIIAKSLVCNKISFDREVKVAVRSRIDFLTSTGIGIEVKKGKPNSRQVESQVRRYLASHLVKALILVVERNVFSHITEHNEKPVKYISLSKSWGIAL